MSFRARFWRELARSANGTLADVQHALRQQIKYGDRERDFEVMDQIYRDVCVESADLDRLLTVAEMAEPRVVDD